MTKNAPAGTTIRRFDGDAPTHPGAAVRARFRPSAATSSTFQRLKQAKPGTSRTSSNSPKLYNGACTRLGEKEINAFANAFIDKIRANGELAEDLREVDEQSDAGRSRTAFAGIPFTAS